MYLAERAAMPASTGRRRGRIGRTVLLLGATSLVTDISAEMVATVMPLYVVFQLGLSPMAFGLLEAVHQGVAAIVRIASGVVTDRWRRPKEVATAGYALSALAKLGLLLVPGGLGAVTSLVAVDRVGKGIRVAPRDALISRAAPPERLATAFGVHRALDTAGSMIGPFAALGVLALAPRAFDAVFLLSFLVAVVGVGLIGLLVDNPPSTVLGPGPARATSPVRAVLGERRVRALAGAAALLGLVTVSDAFLYLGLQRQVGFSPGLLPLLYVATAGVFLLLSVPAGAAADRVGRPRAFAAGYGALLAAYLVLLAPPAGWVTALLCVALLGAHYACTDGVLAALVSALVPVESRATGLAVVTTAAAATKLAASVLFGALWTACGVRAAIAVFAGGLLVLLAVAAALVRRARVEVAGG